MLLVDDVLSPEERTAKRFRLWAAVEEVTQEEITQSQHLSTVLQRGIEVVQHMHNGETRKSVLRYDPSTKQMNLSSQGKGGLFNLTRTETEVSSCSVAYFLFLSELFLLYIIEN